jgi:hypothetical protein
MDGCRQVWVVGCMLLETVSCLTCFLHVSLDHLLVVAGVEGSDSATLPTALHIGAWVEMIDRLAWSVMVCNLMKSSFYFFFISREMHFFRQSIL